MQGIENANATLRADAIPTASRMIGRLTPTDFSIRFASIMVATPPKAPVPIEKMMEATAGET